jgi:hypothetical protein
MGDNGQTWENFEASTPGIQKYDDSHYYVYPSDKTIKNENMLIVLINRNTGSGAEYMIDYLHHLENVLFIGMPSAGMANGSTLGEMALQNSNISFSFGNIWRQANPVYFKEGRGYLPDLWMENVEAKQLAYLLAGAKK